MLAALLGLALALPAPANAPVVRCWTTDTPHVYVVERGGQAYVERRTSC